MASKINVYPFGAGNKFEMIVTSKKVYANTRAKARRIYKINWPKDLRGLNIFCNHLLI